MAPTVERVRLDTGLEHELLVFAPSDPTCDRTLLLLHGFADLAWGWLPVVETGLLDRLHLLVPSFRGHGASDWIGAGGTYYFADYVADLESLVRAHARPRLYIAGHSMGGMAASLFAGTYPARVDRLAILEGLSVPEAPTTPARMREAIAGRATALGRRGTPASPGGRRFPSLEAAAQRMVHHDPTLRPELALAIARHGCLELPDGAWVYRHDPLHATRSPVGFEVALAQRFWREIACDVLYVEGAASPARLVGEERTRRLGSLAAARSLREVEIAGAGHMMLRHQPLATARVLSDFFA